jgi:menaquinone-dependent protoporphyrinogen oxidase
MTHHIDRVLVAYAGSGGSTRSVAEFVATRLHAHGLAADVRNLDDQPELDGYDAVVVGSAVHNTALMPVADRFLRDHVDALHLIPVWLFSMGIGPSLRGPIGGRLRTIIPPKIAEVCELVGPREYHAFAGVVPRSAFPLISRIILRLCGGRYGDLRDWQAINAWSTDIARYLHPTVPA